MYVLKKYIAPLCFLMVSLLNVVDPSLMARVKSSHNKTTVIFDSDASYEDWPVLLYLLNDTNIDVKAVTVSGTGEAHVTPGVKNMQRILELAKHGKIPVAGGREKAYLGANEFPASIRKSMDNLMDIPLQEANNTHVDTTGAVKLMAKTLRESNDPVVILSVGPLTNIADLMYQHPELISKISAIYIMGGAIDVRGNIQAIMPKSDNAHAEWNFFTDPLSVEVVFASGVPIVLTPLDVTNHVPVNQKFVDKIDALQPTNITQFVREVFARVLMEEENVEKDWSLWDTVAAFSLLQPASAPTSTVRLKVHLNTDSRFGSLYHDTNGYPVKVLKPVKPDLVINHFLNSLKDISAKWGTSIQ